MVLINDLCYTFFRRVDRMANYLKKFINDFNDINTYYSALVDKTKNKEYVGITNEWLIDNFYIVVEHKTNFVQNKKDIKKRIKMINNIYYIIRDIVIKNNYNVSLKILADELKKYQKENNTYLSYLEIESIKDVLVFLYIDKLNQICSEESKKLYKKQYEPFRSVFKNIHKKCVEYEINDLVKFFEESDIDIPPDGDIDIKDFRDVMNNIGVPYNVQFDTLVNRLKNMKKKPKDMIKLVEFLSIYNLFAEDEDDNEEKKSEEKDKDKESNIEKEDDKNKKYVYKNAHRKFTQDDIDYITEICEGMAEIIIDELHDSITNFFRKKDKNNQGYITFDDFKDILYRELKIDYKSDIENFQVFFDFVLSDKMVEGEDIIETKKIINILKTYSGRDKPENIQDDEEEEDITKIRTQNQKKILFAEEEVLKGQNAPNLKTDIKDNIINTKSENEEINEDSNNIPIEQINTQTITSPVSFEKIMSEFARYLFTNKIRFSSIFPSINLEKIINNQTITDEALKLGFENASFHLSDKEFSVIMTHFDPINKSKVVVEELKHEIEKYAPLYFKQNFQKIDNDELDKKIKAKGREMEQSAASNFGKNIYNANLLNGMNKIQNYIDRKKLTPEKFFFGKFGNNENLNINEDTFKDTLIPEDPTKKTKTELIPYLTLPEVDAIYKAIDTKLTDKVTLGEIITFFNKYMKKGDNIINLNEQSSLNEYINSELKILFDNFDTDKNDIISFDDFFKVLKSLDHKSTKAEALKIPELNNSSNINRETFNKIMISYIQKELFIQKEETFKTGYAICFEDIVRYVNALLPSNEDIATVALTTKSKYPLPSVREAIANSLIHQDLYITGTGPVVEVFENRIEVTNPGTPLVDIMRIIDKIDKIGEKVAGVFKKVGDFVGIGDDGHGKAAFLGVDHGEADPVDGDGAFGHGEVVLFGVVGEVEPPAAVLIDHFLTYGGLVDVPLHDVPVEAAVHAHAAFEVDLVTDLPRAEVGLQHGLVHGGHHVLPLPPIDTHHREAAAVVGHALVDAELVGEIRLYGEVEVGPVLLYPDDFTCLFYDSCEHNHPKIKNPQRYIKFKYEQSPVFREADACCADSLFSAPLTSYGRC